MSFRTHDALPGFLGSIFITAGSLGVGWFPLAANVTDIPLISFLQTQTLGLALTRSLVVVGVALLLQSWLIVGADVVRGELTDVRSMVTTMCAWALPLMASAPLFSRDVYAYFMQGRMQEFNINPYHGAVAQVPGWFTSGVDPMWAQSAVPYGPGWLAIERAVAHLVGDWPLGGVLLFRTIAAACVAITAWCVVDIASTLGRDARVALWLGMMNPLVLMHFISGAHNDAVMVCLMAIAISASHRRHIGLAVVFTALAWSIKPVGLAVLPFVITGQTWRHYVRNGVAAVSAVAAIAVCMSTALQVSPTGWIAALTTPGSVRSWLSPMTALGMGSGALLELFGFDGAMDQSIAVFRLLGTLLIVATCSWLIITRDRRSIARSSALALASLVAFGPVVQPWYLLWSFPLFATSGVRHMRTAIGMVALFALHGLANSSATADTFVDLSDGVALALVVVVISAVLVSSHQERQLITEAGRMAI